MADTKRGKVRKLGPFRLGRVHGNDDVVECTRLGPLYEARNERTVAPDRESSTSSSASLGP